MTIDENDFFRNFPPDIEGVREIRKTVERHLHETVMGYRRPTECILGVGPVIVEKKTQIQIDVPVPWLFSPRHFYVSHDIGLDFNLDAVRIDGKRIEDLRGPVLCNVFSQVPGLPVCWPAAAQQITLLVYNQSPVAIRFSATIRGLR